MFIGIDVGGTFTDGVIISEQKITAAVKVPTYPQLTKSITEVIEQILAGRDPRQVKRIVLSTTIVTNLIAQESLAKVGLLLMPGPGVNPARLKFAGPVTIVAGAVDYRGRVLEGFKKEQLSQAVKAYRQQGINKIVVACKFSQRNNKLEKEAVQYLSECFPQVELLASSEVSGLLNWVRRANGAVYTLATRAAYHSFVREVEDTLTELGLNCPVQILKADGGTLPLEASLYFPLEAIFSGPAASALGALATISGDLTAVVMDIGGTTTDLALLLKGVPLLSERGAFLQENPIPVRAIAVSSVALGGDTAVELVDGQLKLGTRQGPALCLGGPCLTVTDLLVYQGLCQLELTAAARSACENLAAQLGQAPAEMADLVIEQFVSSLEAKLEKMFSTWEEEPAYRIWQVLNPRTARPDVLICQGGPAAGLGPLWAEKKGWQVKVSPYAQVANAVGAALARDTLKLDYIADTEQMTYTTNLGGYQGRLSKKLTGLSEARSTAQNLFGQIAGEWGLDLTEAPELLYEESFNLVRGWSTTGKIMQIGLQTPPGLRTSLREEEVSHD